MGFLRTDLILMISPWETTMFSPVLASRPSHMATSHRESSLFILPGFIFILAMFTSPNSIIGLELGRHFHRLYAVLPPDPIWHRLSV